MKDQGKGTYNPATSIVKVTYTHDAMIDLVIAEPQISQGAIAKHFGYTPAWVSQIFNSDAFQARLAERKADLVDPTIRLTIEEKLKGLAAQSVQVIANKLEATNSAELAISALSIATKALGYGARPVGNQTNTQNNFFVQVPGKAATTEAWENAYNPAKTVTVEAERE